MRCHISGGFPLYNKFNKISVQLTGSAICMEIHALIMFIGNLQTVKKTDHLAPFLCLQIYSQMKEYHSTHKKKKKQKKTDIFFLKVGGNHSCSGDRSQKYTQSLVSTVRGCKTVPPSWKPHSIIKMLFFSQFFSSILTMLQYPTL